MVIARNNNIVINGAGCYFAGNPKPVDIEANPTFGTSIFDIKRNLIPEPTQSERFDSIIESLTQNYNHNFNVTQNLFTGTAEDLNKLLKNTKIAGLGEALMEVQEKYGVSALFLMSILKIESGYGAAPARDGKIIRKYNIAGLKTRKGTHQENSSYEQCIDSLGSSLSRLYFKNGRVTIGAIQKIYCPSRQNWTTEIVKEMKNISSRIIQNYTEK